MIDYEVVERRFNVISQKFLVPAFRKLALTHCATHIDFYDSLELFENLADKISPYLVRKDILDGYRLRLINLVSRLSIEGIKTEKNDAFFLSKVYDPKLNENMVVAYYPFAKAISDDWVQSIPGTILARTIDVNDREGFSMVEMTLLLCLIVSLRGRSLATLNRPIVTDNELKRAKPRLRKIRDNLYSKNMEIVLSSFILDWLADYYQESYEELLNRHLTSFWLPENKRHLKTARYAVQRYGGGITKEYYTYEELEKLSDEQSIRLTNENGDLQIMQWLFFKIVPMTEAFIDGSLPLISDDIGAYFEIDENTNTLSIKEHLLSSPLVSGATKEHIKNSPESYYEATPEDFLVSQKLAVAINSYIRGISNAAVSLMSMLQEAQIAEGLDWQEYFINL